MAVDSLGMEGARATTINVSALLYWHIHKKVLRMFFDTDIHEVSCNLNAKFNW